MVRKVIAALANLPMNHPYLNRLPNLDLSLAAWFTGKGDRAIGDAFAKTYYGANRPSEISLRELVNATFEPGGYQLKGGYGALVDKIADHLGREHIELNSQISKIQDQGHSVLLTGPENRTIRGGKAIFTGSTELLNRGDISIVDNRGNDALSKETRQALSGIGMGNLSKVLFSIKPEFFEKHPDLTHAHNDFTDGTPMFVHLGSANLPLMTVCHGGEDAVNIERRAKTDLAGLSQELLARIAAAPHLNVVTKHLANVTPTVTDWSQNPYTKGSYSFCKTGHYRTGPLTDGNVTICGEALDPHTASYVTGAIRSGETAANRLIEAERQQSGGAVIGR